MSAIELVQNGEAGKPDAELTKAIAGEALARGVLLLTCGVRGNVIRFLPPLTIEPELLAEALDTVGDVMLELAGSIQKAS
jgi:4-aminobutyrate aminotransferase/(S)-3-amino-2-methylpropionate transaminase